MVMGLLVMPMFLLAASSFLSIDSAAGLVVQMLPLYHGVGMLRQLTTGNISPSIAGHLAYLVTLGIVAFSLAMYRLERALIK